MRHAELTLGGTKVVILLAVAETLREMQKYTGMPPGTRAATRSFTEGPATAEVVFCAKHLDIEYIAHEAVHVAYAIGRRGVNPWEDQFDSEEEERIAYPAGVVTDSLLAGLTSLGYKWNVHATTKLSQRLHSGPG